MLGIKTIPEEGCEGRNLSMTIEVKKEDKHTNFRHKIEVVGIHMSSKGDVLKKELKCVDDHLKGKLIKGVSFIEAQ